MFTAEGEAPTSWRLWRYRPTATGVYRTFYTVSGAAFPPMRTRVVACASSSGGGGPPPRHEARVRSAHPGTINLPGNWTYTGDTVRASLRNRSLAAGERERYRVCMTKRVGQTCRQGALVGSAWDTISVRVLPPLRRLGPRASSSSSPGTCAATECTAPGSTSSSSPRTSRRSTPRRRVRRGPEPGTSDALEIRPRKLRLGPERPPCCCARAPRAPSCQDRSVRQRGFRPGSRRGESRARG